MERERTGAAPEAETANRSPSDLGALIAAARAAQGQGRSTVAGTINDLLIAMRAPGNEAGEANAILAALDVSKLNGLVDGRGRDCRKEAVETLLACGFPHALKVSPEDLAYARAKPKPKQRVLPAAEDDAPEHHPPNVLAMSIAVVAAVFQILGAWMGDATGKAWWLSVGSAVMFAGLAFRQRGGAARDGLFGTVLMLAFAVIFSALSAVIAYNWWPIPGALLGVALFQVLAHETPHRYRG